MPEPRAVLDKLPIAALKALADDASVDVPDRRNAASIAGALEKLGAGHRRVLLADLPRNVLKEAARSGSTTRAGSRRCWSIGSSPTMRDRGRPLPGRDLHAIGLEIATSQAASPARVPALAEYYRADPHDPRFRSAYRPRLGELAVALSSEQWDRWSELDADTWPNCGLHEKILQHLATLPGAQIDVKLEIRIPPHSDCLRDCDRLEAHFL